MDYDIRKLNDYLWELPKTGGMRVPARIYATEEMIAQIVSDKAPQQAANVAHLPGIVTASLAMPDIHWGYGFPIGGVAAFDLDEGVISPGGVGYDINCGVRLMASRLTREQVEPRLRELVNQLFRDVATGVGAAGALTVSVDELRCVVSARAITSSRSATSRKFTTRKPPTCSVSKSTRSRSSSVKPGRLPRAATLFARWRKEASLSVAKAAAPWMRKSPRLTRMCRTSSMPAPSPASRGRSRSSARSAASRVEHLQPSAEQQCASTPARYEHRLE